MIVFRVVRKIKYCEKHNNKSDWLLTPPLHHHYILYIYIVDGYTSYDIFQINLSFRDGLLLLLTTLLLNPHGLRSNWPCPAAEISPHTGTLREKNVR